MKYIASALVLAALLGTEQQTSAIRLKAQFTDDLIKSLTEDMAKDAEQEEAPQAAAQVEAKAEAKTEAKAESKAKETKKADSKKKDAKAADKKKASKKKEEPKKAEKSAAKATKKEDEDIPMDAAAIKAYSSVIADAAEDSEPKVPVTYSVTMQEEKPVKHDEFNPDPMGSMIQNEIAEIKTASIKAAKEKDD